MTLQRLYELARERNIKNPRKYKKQELLDILLSGRVPADEDGGGDDSPAAAPAAVLNNGDADNGSFDQPRPRRRSAAADSGADNAGAAEPGSEGEGEDAEGGRSERVRPERGRPERGRPGERPAERGGQRPGVYGSDFTPPSRQADESDYIEDEPSGPAPAPFNGGGGYEPELERPRQVLDPNAYPSSQIANARQARRQQRYDERNRGRGERGPGGPGPDQRERPGQQLPRGMAPQGVSRDLEQSVLAKGVLEIVEDANYGFIRQRAFHLGEDDIYVSMSQIKKFGLRTGDLVEGFARAPRDQERYQSLVKIEKVNEQPYEEGARRISFEKLTPVYPHQRVLLETDPKEISTRLIDLFSPIGRGTRGIIVAKPKAGKTVMLKKIAHALAQNHPDIELIALLIDERPEEVTDFERNVNGMVVSSTFDEKPENHIQVAELIIEYAKRRVEQGKDVFVLLDSLTRLARAYNLTCPPSGKTLSGGLDPNSLYKPKRFLGAARKIEDGGSLTILCTALVETGSRLDDIIFEEFKGTANMELHLSRELADKRIFPSVDIIKSGTRHEELLYHGDEMDVVWRLRKMVADMDEAERMNRLITKLYQTKSNAELLMLIHRATE
ncbi:transcription termination factor Rho [bacterium]|nr:transcription termination factor Rho [bacterium]